MANTSYKIIFGDQKTDEWQKLREGKITGSQASKVKGTGDAFMNQTLAMMTTKWKPKEASGKDIDRGNELEPEARKEYIKATGQKVIDNVAFIEHENGRYGISPDGIPFKGKTFDEVVKKLLEIKCPDVPNHIKNIINNKVPKEYVDQIVHGFVTVEDCDEIDFVSYCPQFKFKPLHIITVKRSAYIVDISTTRIHYEKFISKLDENYSKLIS
jgi:predicted phage-related endonuclease